MKRAHKKMLPASITEGGAEGAEEEEYEYGDVEARSGEEDSDYSILTKSSPPCSWRLYLQADTFP